MNEVTTIDRTQLEYSAATAMPAIPEVRDAILGGTTGSLVAWDPVARKEAWRIDFDGPWNGGTLATAGNLVFQGNARENFVAYAADTGRELWSFPAPRRTSATWPAGPARSAARPRRPTRCPAA